MGVQFMQSDGLYSQLLQQAGNLLPISQQQHEACHSWKHAGPESAAGYFKSLLEGGEASVSGAGLHVEDNKPLIMRSLEFNAAHQCLSAVNAAHKSPPANGNAASSPSQASSPAQAVKAMPSLPPKASPPISPLKRGREACPVNEGMSKKDKKGSGEDGGGGGKEKSKAKGNSDGAGAPLSGRKGGIVKSPKPAKAVLPAEPPKTDYVHVRARRGQATDSHSLAERVRREKISERMKFLQDLVPGCSKITGKALILDEIINYVQSLQNQVEFLAMRLAAVNPKLEHTSLSNSTEEEIASPFMEEAQDGIDLLPKSLSTQTHSTDLHFDSLPTFYQGLFDDSNFNPSIASDLSTSTCDDSNLTNMDFSHLA